MRQKNSGLFVLILILATVATSLIVWRLFFFKPQPTTLPVTPTPTPSFLIPSPTPIPSVATGKGDSPEDILKSVQSKYPLFRFVPYQELGFRIDYVAPLTLGVTLKRDTPETRQKVLDWIQSKNVDPKTHEIIWKVDPQL